MRIHEAVNLITRTYNSSFRQKSTYIFTGQPGIGKSAAWKIAADQMGVPLYDLRVSMLGRTELMGIPMPDKENKTMEFYSLDLLPKSGEGIVLLEELTSAPKSVQTPLYQLAWDKRLWNYKLPEGIMLGATGNRIEDRATAESMSTALSSRFQHIHIDITIPDFKEYCTRENIFPWIPTYIEKTGLEALNNFSPKLKQETFACPRTWELLSWSLWALCPSRREFMSAMQNPVQRAQIMEVAIGTVGEQQGTGFITYCQLMKDSLDPQIVLRDPVNAPIPVELSEMFVVHQQLVNLTKFDNLAHIATYYDRIKKSNMPEFYDKYITDTRIKLCGTDMDLKKTYNETMPGWAKWSTDNMTYIMNQNK
jgi:hypothetical protein